jgi:hypothetical protein
MFTQFHSRYPTGSLVSELVQIYDGSYIVRTVIQVGGVTLASGLAAAHAIEEAEDHARWRALAVLGIVPSPLTHTPLTHNSLAHGYETHAQLIDSGEKHPPVQLNPARAFSIPPSSLPASHPPQHFPQTADLETQAEWDFNRPPDLSEYEQFSPSYPTTNAPPPNRRKAEMGPPKGRGRNQPPPAPPVPSLDHTALDLSDIIAQTSVELKRLGWSESQGRTYLQRTYNKRSRQQLTDEELLDFLNYLQSESVPGELAF